MSTTRWRGTMVYTGALAAIGAAGFARFVLAPDDPPASSLGSEVAPGVPDGSAGTSGGATASPGTPSSGSVAPDSAGSDSAAPNGAAPDSGGSGTGGSGSSSADTVTIVGAVEQTRYGDVQVAVTFQGDRITDVQTLQAPDRDRRDQQISSMAVPVLAQEVLDAQTARVDTVSGATYTSEGYLASVQSAIDQRG
ncbi:FMN-binding protein [Cellulomonas sp. URHB0016]